jgi:hypothetical protein
MITQQILKDLPKFETCKMQEDSNNTEHEEAVAMIQTAIEEAHLERTLEETYYYPDLEKSLDERSTLPVMMPPSGSRNNTSYEPDHSEEIPQYKSKVTMEPFHMLVATWAEDTGISRKQYESLREIMMTLDNTDPIKTLPKNFSTLRRNFLGQFSLLPLRRVKIPIVSSKLPTLSPLEKNLTVSAMKWLIFMDPKALIAKLLQSPLFRKGMYQGMAQIVRRPSELWHSVSWGSSIRTTSGEFAHYPDGLPIFPSDIVYFRCDVSTHACKTHSDMHLGRVLYVGKVHEPPESNNFITYLYVQMLIRYEDASENLKDFLQLSGPAFKEDELLVHEGNCVFLKESNILQQETDIYLDYNFQRAYSTAATRNIQKTTCKYLIRRVINLEMTSVRPINLSTPIRGELEIAVYGRQHLINTLHNRPCISFPYQLFIDGFGLYRSMYRSLMGIYMIPACLSMIERSKMSNIYSITLGPHGSNFHDVISSLGALRDLDKSIEIDIDGQKTTVVAFALAFLGDMPQQNDNAGFKRPTAIRSCRQCLVKSDERNKLDYDIIQKGRYHYQILQSREVATTKSPIEQEKFYRETGLSSLQTPLLKIAPCLNLVTFFPSDPCHSEYSGISKIAHKLLIENILSSTGQQQYYSRLRLFPFPQGWSRLQSPLNHLESYQLQEHARASIIIPLVLRLYMTRSWIKPVYCIGIARVYNSTQITVEDIITGVFAAIAKSNSVLCWSSSTDDWKQISEIIKEARSGLQNLLEAAAIAADESRPGRRHYPASSVDLRSPSPALSQISNWSGQFSNFGSKKSKALRDIKRRPNIHIGVHYKAQAHEYGVPWNSNSLLGEGKHKCVFFFIQT